MLITLGKWKKKLFCMMKRCRGDKDCKLFSLKKVTGIQNFVMLRYHRKGRGMMIKGLLDVNNK